MSASLSWQLELLGPYVSGLYSIAEPSYTNTNRFTFSLTILPDVDTLTQYIPPPPAQRYDTKTTQPYIDFMSPKRPHKHLFMFLPFRLCVGCFHPPTRWCSSPPAKHAPNGTHSRRTISCWRIPFETNGKDSKCTCSQYRVMV